MRLLLPLLIITLAACAREPLVIHVPANPENSQTAQAVNSAMSVLKQLENNPDNIRIETSPAENYSEDIRGAF